MSLNRTFVAGTTVLAASDMNGLQAAWDTYAPTPAGFSVGNGSLTGRYLRVGKSLRGLRINFTAGSSSSYSGAMTVTLPAGVHATGAQVIPIYINAAGTVYATACLIAAGASTVPLTVPTSTGNCSLVAMSNTSPNPGITGSFVLGFGQELA